MCIIKKECMILSLPGPPLFGHFVFSDASWEWRSWFILPYIKILWYTQ